MADDDRKKKAAAAAALLFLLPRRAGSDAPDEFVSFDHADDALHWCKHHAFRGVIARGPTAVDSVRRLRAAGFAQSAVVVGSDLDALRVHGAGLGDVRYASDAASDDEIAHSLHEGVSARAALAKLRGEPLDEDPRAPSDRSPVAKYAKYALLAAALIAAAVFLPRLFGGPHASPDSAKKSPASHQVAKSNGAPGSGSGGAGGSPAGGKGPKSKSPGGGAGSSSAGSDNSGAAGSPPSLFSASAAPSGEVPTMSPSMSTPSPGPSSSGPKASTPPLPSDASLVVLDGNGSPVVSQNGGVARAPASTLKLVVAATANTFLGPSFRFRTTIGSAAAPHDGSLPNVIVRGDGDPTLASADFAEAARQLRAKGIRNVGDVAVVTKPFEGPEQNPEWSAEDKAAPYGAGSSAVSLDENLRNNVPVTGIPEFAGTSLVRELRAAGITVNGKVSATPDARIGWTGWTRESAALPVIVRRMLYESNNLYAEQLLRRIGVARYGVGSAETGTRVEMEYLQRLGIPVDGMHVVDGCGLSESDRITAITMATLLARLPPQEAAALYADLPVLGSQGTVATRLSGSNAHVKDGRLRDVDALAGYVDTLHHGRAAFAFMINRTGLSREQTHAFGDNVAMALAKY